MILITYAKISFVNGFFILQMNIGIMYVDLRSFPKTCPWVLHRKDKDRLLIFLFPCDSVLATFERY